MNKAFDLLGAYAIKAVYAGKGKDEGSTEWSDTIVEFEGVKWQLLTIGGSDEFLDWIQNFILAQIDGVKTCSYLSAHRIMTGKWGKLDCLRKLLFIKKIEPFKRLDMPLAIFCHSKSGPTGPYLKKTFCNDEDYGCSFCPAPGSVKGEEVKNYKYYIDPNDPVPNLGKPFFQHYDVEIEYLEDEGGIIVKDHFVEHIIAYLRQYH